MMKLADRIDNAIVALEELLNEALRELERYSDDPPEEVSSEDEAKWIDDLSQAGESAQNALIAIGLNEHVDALQKMLRRIDEHERLLEERP